MSQARKNVTQITGDLAFPEVGNFPTWEVFTQKSAGDAHIHAGSLSAPDVSLAQQFAREHYGQDQECCSIWIGLRSTILADDGGEDSYEVFVQWNAGDRHVHVGSVVASNGKDARTKCKEEIVGDKSTYAIWTCPFSQLSRIDDATDMIWRTTDQRYRLAKGYSKIVRKKWDALRTEKAVDKYQEEDLKDTF